MSIIPHKTCITCQQTKPASDFYIVDKRTGRLSSRCRPCRIIQAGTYKKNHCEENQQSSRAYRVRHADKIKAKYSPLKRAAEYAKERLAAIASVRQWRKNNPDLKRAQKHRRRARIAQNGGSYTAAEWQALKAEQQYTCPACGRKEPEIRLTVDHIVPITKGGTNDISNIQGLCRECNNRKRTRTIDYR